MGAAFLVFFKREFDCIGTVVAVGKLLAVGGIPPSTLDTIRNCDWSSTTFARGEVTDFPTPPPPSGATVTPYGGGCFVVALIFLRSSWIRERSEGLICVERRPFGTSLFVPLLTSTPAPSC